MADPIREWLDIPVYLEASNYQVSRDGRVRNKTTRYVLTPEPRPLTGYTYVTLTRDDGTTFVIGLHVLIAHAFLPLDPDRPYVDHIDRVKTNNDVSNLRRVTPKENSANRAASTRSSKAIEQLADNGVLIQVWPSTKEAATVLGIYRYSINMACNGKVQLVSGYRWRYLVTGPAATEKEEWRTITYDGVEIQASSCGRIKLERSWSYGHETQGRMMAHISRADRTTFRVPVHDIICTAFHGPRPTPESVARALDHDRLNNRAANLEWSTMTEIYKDRKPPARGRRGKTVQQYTREGELLASYASMILAASAVNIPASSISVCCRGKKPTAGGFIWRYAEEEPIMKRIPAPEEPVDE
jgi:hypothetical protein